MSDGFPLFDRRAEGRPDDGYGRYERDQYDGDYADERSDRGGPARPDGGYERYDDRDGGYAEDYDADYDGDYRAEDDYEDEPPPKRKRGRTKLLIGGALAVIILLVVGFGVYEIHGIGSYSDYTGSGSGDVIIQVHDGDTTTAIGTTLTTDGVVASATAFVKASVNTPQVGDLQPGYYELKKHSSGAAAVSRIVNPASRVGQLQIKSGWMLDDTSSNGKTNPGIISYIAKATCATVNGKSTCLTPDAVRTAIQTSSATELGVPDWAAPAFTAADPKHRLEGLIMPGIYDLMPGQNAVADLRGILAQSAAQMQAAGLPSTVQQKSGFSPYQILILASIIERESGVTSDMPKISRVLYNRLSSTDPTVNRLSLDSTVDYALDKPQVLTSPSQRPGAGAYDTYDNPGLPPTPISSPSADAIQAAMSPVAGNWLYFVVCEKNGTSCFASTFAQHQANIVIAQHNGAY
jgi:UPF0755 protein